MKRSYHNTPCPFHDYCFSLVVSHTCHCYRPPDRDHGRGELRRVRRAAGRAARQVPQPGPRQEEVRPPGWGGAGQGGAGRGGVGEMGGVRWVE